MALSSVCTVCEGWWSVDLELCQTQAFSFTRTTIYLCCSRCVSLPIKHRTKPKNRSRVAASTFPKACLHKRLHLSPHWPSENQLRVLALIHNLLLQEFKCFHLHFTVIPRPWRGRCAGRRAEPTLPRCCLSCCQHLYLASPTHTDES